ncbi:MAG TPA: hypothetical protein VFR07_12355 [Mycobacteriales bacterium]|nr:hypothetical protein [Mycobacteriales bacterium]
MPDPLASPGASRLAAPRWLDARLVLGVLLVLVSVVVGARVLASADTTQSVWVATRDLAAGSTLAEGDLRAGQVRLADVAGSYLLATGAQPLGYVLERGIGAEELLPRTGLVRPGAPGEAYRDVAVPVAAGHLPEDLRAGQQVDVYVTVTTGTATAASNGTRLVLSRVPVALRPKTGGLSTAGASGVVLSVPEADAAALVAAVQAGAVDLVRVPRAAEVPGAAAPAG